MFSVSWHGDPCLLPCQWILISTLCTRRLSSLACLTLVCSDRLRSCSPWRRYCSLAVLLSSRSRHNLSLTLSRFMGVELHSEEFSVAFSRSMGVELDSKGSIVSLNMNFVKFEMYVYLSVSFCSIYIFGIWPHIFKQTYIHTASCNAVLLVWGSLRLAPIYCMYQI